jgi:pimeloyl-ACP methyl ester carboxylesterase
MPIKATASNTTAPTQLLRGRNETYAYRRFGGGPARPLLLLQHFTGTLDNWDPAVTDPLATGREVILFDSAGVGRSIGIVPNTIGGRRRMRSISWTAWGWTAVTSSDSRSAEWSRSRWRGTAPRFSAG